MPDEPASQRGIGAAVKYSVLGAEHARDGRAVPSGGPMPETPHFAKQQAERIFFNAVYEPDEFAAVEHHRRPLNVTGQQQRSTDTPGSPEMLSCSCGEG